MNDSIDALRDIRFPHFPFHLNSLPEESRHFFEIELVQHLSSYYTGNTVFMILVLMDPDNKFVVQRLCDEVSLLLSCIGFMCSFSYCTVRDLNYYLSFENVDAIVCAPGSRALLIDTFPTIHYIEVNMNVKLSFFCEYRLSMMLLIKICVKVLPAI